jgi:hypothetical protein
MGCKLDFSVITNIALTGRDRVHMSPGKGADWAITPLPELTFDDFIVFQLCV